MERDTFALLASRVRRNPYFGGLCLLAGFLLAHALLLQAPQIAARFSPYYEADSIGRDARDFNELSKRFTALAEDKGAPYAFEVLRRAVLPRGSDLHLLGHGIGEKLYEQEGVAGIARCTQEFRNACSHTIVIGALTEYGEAALPRIRESCLKAPGGKGAYTMCYHGLGHGVFAYFGYSLPETISFCRKTGTQEYSNREYVECVGGAVMELMGGGGHDKTTWEAARKKYLTDDPLSPCINSVIPADTKAICLTYLTPRLFEAAGANLASPDPATFPKATSFCKALNSRELRETCFAGFGKEFVPLAVGLDIRRVDKASDAELSLAIRWCSVIDDDEGKSACAAEELSSLYWGGENDSDASFRLCALMRDDAMADACFKKLALSIAFYAGPGSQLCERLPDPYVSTCKEELPKGSSPDPYVYSQ